MKLDEKLVHLRKEKGLTQLELAEAVKVSRQAVSKWESGGGTPSTENLMGLSELYGVSIDYLLNEEEREPDDGSVSKGEMKDTPKPVHESQKRNAIKWIAIACAIFVLMITVWVFTNNKGRESHLLGEMSREEVVTDRNFTIGW